MPNIRCCNKCEQTKPIEEFRGTGHENGNRRHICLVCEREQNKARNKLYYQKNREKCLTYVKGRYQKKTKEPQPVEPVEPVEPAEPVEQANALD